MRGQRQLKYSNLTYVGHLMRRPSSPLLTGTLVLGRRVTLRRHEMVNAKAADRTVIPSGFFAVLAGWWLSNSARVSDGTARDRVHRNGWADARAAGDSVLGHLGRHRAHTRGFRHADHG
jgi:hypothetical protein